MSVSVGWAEPRRVSRRSRRRSSSGLTRAWGLGGADARRGGEGCCADAEVDATGAARALASTLYFLRTGRVTVAGGMAFLRGTRVLAEA